MHEREGLRYTPRTDWIFPRLSHQRYDKLCTRVVAALETLDSERTLRLLLKKIQRVQRLADDLDFRPWWHLERLDAGGRPDSRNVVSALVASVVGLAHRMTQGRPHAAEAERVMEVIDSYHGEFFSRIRYLVLAPVGNHLQERLESDTWSSRQWATICRRGSIRFCNLKRRVVQGITRQSWRCCFAHSSGTRPMERGRTTPRQSRPHPTLTGSAAS